MNFRVWPSPHSPPPLEHHCWLELPIRGLPVYIASDNSNVTFISFVYNGTAYWSWDDSVEFSSITWNHLIGNPGKFVPTPASFLTIREQEEHFEWRQKRSHAPDTHGKRTRKTSMNRIFNEALKSVITYTAS